MHLILTNLPWRHLQERAEKTPGDKKRVESMLSHRVITSLSSIQHINFLAVPAVKPRTRTSARHWPETLVLYRRRVFTKA